MANEEVKQQFAEKPMKGETLGMTTTTPSK